MEQNYDHYTPISPPEVIAAIDDGTHLEELLTPTWAPAETATVSVPEQPSPTPEV